MRRQNNGLLMGYSAPKGVFDILPEEPNKEAIWRQSDKWQHVESVIRETAHDYDYKEIRTPLFEETDLFVRSAGDASDIVSKEMYTFKDKADRSLTLRPEGTAPVMRAFIENRLQAQGSVHKFFYIGPMFRYERPQAGRYRQHHQFGVEAIGVGRPAQDVECIDLLYETYRRLGLHSLHVIINSVGDEESRANYKRALQDYLRPHMQSLSAESQERFVKNPLRILDSKNPVDIELLGNAPSILDALSLDAASHFQEVTRLLDKIQIPYQINPKLVRGLDYYTKTVFEVASGSLGAQNSLGGGGRYDGLLPSLGGPALPAVGFGTGIERILQTLAKQETPFPQGAHPFVFLIALGEKSYDFCFSQLTTLRRAHIPAEMELSLKKVQHGLQLANKLQADYVVIIGDDELIRGTAQLKQMHLRETREISLVSFVEEIKALASFLKK